MDVFIAYCSPSGSTEKIARVIKDVARTLGCPVQVADLGLASDKTDFMENLRAAKGNACLFIGSPVYASRAVPQVMRFIENLPRESGAGAVPFVTWGCVDSGLALYEMGTLLTGRGFRLLGAASLPALHSMLWQVEHPLGEGKPNDTDETALRTLVESVCSKPESANSISTKDLDYQPPQLRSMFENFNIAAVKNMGILPQLHLNSDLCTRCDICGQSCPSRAITCSPYPVFGGECIFCYKCLRICPEKAIEADFSAVEATLRKFAADIDEKPVARVWY